MKTAILLGATGLTGSFLLKDLLNSKHYSKVIVFSRKMIEISNSKLEVVITDFADINSISTKIIADDIFCCIGSTIKKAGTKENFRKIDYDIPLLFAQIGKKNGVNSFFLVSSVGANGDSYNFYLKTKGEIENAILSCGFERTVIFRPSVLLGERDEKRVLEKAGQNFLEFISPILLGSLAKYRGIKARNLSRFIVRTAELKSYKVVYENDEML